jgi:putative sigma-54 modulation protein
MKIEVRGPTFSRSDALRAHAERRLGAALGRFQTHVARATVRLTDVNGPRGGVDQRCRVSLTVRHRAADRVGAALSRAVDRDRRGRRAGTRR